MTYGEAFFILGNIPIPTDDEDFTIAQYQEAKSMALDLLGKEMDESWIHLEV